MIIPEELIPVFRLVIALIFGALIGFERDIHGKPAGIRTHMLVSVSTCLLTLVSIEQFPLDSARITAQIVTGIGFIGAGAIIASQEGVVGLTTAAGVFMTAAVGIATGTGSYTLAFVATILSVFILFIRLDL